jgi:tripartite-type tricarboxylate transporter receptor subunit TctC
MFNPKTMFRSAARVNGGKSFPKAELPCTIIGLASVGQEPIIRKFSEELNKIAREPDMKPLLTKVALSPYPGTPDELAALTKKDYERFGRIIRQLNIKAE